MLTISGRFLPLDTQHIIGGSVYQLGILAHTELTPKDVDWCARRKGIVHTDTEGC